MKKKLAALMLSLLLVCSMAGLAYADVTYTSLGDVEAGTPVRHLLATVALGSPVTADQSSIPPGCQISTEEAAGGVNVYISGTPNTVGSYNCTVDLGNGNSIVCPVNVVAGKPQVTVSEDVACSINGLAQLSVNASVAGSGSLSYQWYVAPNDSVANGQPISGAVNSSYSAPTATAGTNYYYCIVTNNSGSQTRSTVSDTIEVRVSEVPVQAIFVNSMPTKLDYMEGDSLDTTGLSIRVDYADGSCSVIYSGFAVSPTVLETAGEQQIEVSYLNHKCSFTVNVEGEEEIVEGIGVLTLPSKTRYNMGDELDIRGLSIKVYTNKGEQTVTDGLSCVPSVLNYSGKQTVTVRYMGKSCTFSVDVNEPEVPLRIDVASRAKKLDYTVGDTLDVSGLIIRLTGSNGSSEEIRSGFSCEPSLLSSPGKQKITVTYEGLQCTYYVNVAANPSATVSPTVTPGPTNTPAPTVTPRPTVDPGDHQPYDTGMNSKVIVIIMIVALVIMAALGGFVLVMQRGGFENIFRNFRR